MATDQDLQRIEEAQKPTAPAAKPTGGAWLTDRELDAMALIVPQIGGAAEVWDQAREANRLREELARRTVVWHTEPPPNEDAVIVVTPSGLWRQHELMGEWRDGWLWCYKSDARRALGLEDA